MKYSSFVQKALAGALLFAAASCDKDKFLGNNLDPNNPQVVTPSVLLTSAQVHTGFILSNEIGRVSDLFTQHYAGILNQPNTYDSYAIRGNFDNEWNFDLYAGVLADAQNIIDNGEQNGTAYVGIAKLLKAYNFALATDLWGDVPYSQALQGNAFLMPRFDKQEDIYKGNQDLGVQSLFDLVRDGLADLDKTPGVVVPGSDDLVYGGNLANWKKFGNTLLLKFANTINRKEPALAASVISEVLAKGPDSYISSGADDFQVPFGTTVGNTNPFYAYNVTNRATDQMASSRFLDSLNVRNDPRLPRYFTTTPANTNSIATKYGIFTGYDNGSLKTVPAIADRSTYSTYILGTSGEAPVRALTSFQTQFILAEAYVDAGDNTKAQIAFQAGISASMLKTNIANADVTAYLNDKDNQKWVTLAGSKEQMRNQIITQKWIALLGNGYESYNDYRRTGYPRLSPVVNPNALDAPKGLIPVRFYYTITEIASNANTIPTPQPTPDVRVWWDVD